MKPVLLTLTLAVTLCAQKPDLTKPPETPPLAPYKLPAVTDTTLPNGMRVLLVQDKRFPIMTARLGFPAGAKYEQADQRGVAETVAALLTQGTKSKSARQIAEQAASLGGSVSASSSPDSMIVSGAALAENTAKLLDLMADVVLNANFPQEEVDLRKQNRKQSLLAARSQAETLANERLAQAVFGDHPYSRLMPTAEAIDKITRDALVQYRDSHLAPNGSVLVLVGALPANDATMKAIASAFGGWEKKDTPAAPPAKFPEPKRSVVLVDRPGSVQADIRIGQLAPTRSAPDYFPAMVADRMLGGGTASRLFLEVREKQGFAYDAHSELQVRNDAAVATAVTQVRNDVIDKAVDAVLGEMNQMASKPAPAEDLSNVKNYINGIFVLQLATQDGVAGQLISTSMAGLPNDYLEKYVTRVRSTEPDQIEAAAKKYIAPEDAAIIIVGDAAKIQEKLGKLGDVKIEKPK